jgi:hypothetical protein
MDQSMGANHSRPANESATATSPLVTALVRTTLLGHLPYTLLDDELLKSMGMRYRVVVLQAIVAGAHSRTVR